MDGKIVFKGKTKTGEKYLIRYPTKDDVSLMLDYINTLSKEQTFISFQGEQLTLEEEEAYLAGVLKNITKKREVMLLVIANNAVIGIAAVTEKERIEKHIGFFGISLSSAFRDQGLGTILMKITLEEAQKHIDELKIVTLSVLSNNPRAYHLYQKLGFKEYGTLPKGAIYRDSYVGHTYMYKMVKEFE